MNQLDQLKEDLSNSTNSNSNPKEKESQNGNGHGSGGGTEELKNFIMKESPPPGNNINLLTSQNLSERETSSSPIV